MGAPQAKCCSPPETAGADTVGSDVQSLAMVESERALNKAIEQKPLWQIHSEEAEKEAKLRLELALKEREKQMLEMKQKQAEAEALAQHHAEQEKTDVAAPKKAAAKKAAPKASVKAAATPTSAAPAEPTENEKHAKAIVDEAHKTTKDMSSLRYELEVKIASARNLRNADWVPGGSDPYCLCEVQGSSKSKFKTKTVENKSDPVWNQGAKLTIARGDSLRFTVFDKDLGKADDLLGWVEIPHEQLLKSFEGELKLKDSSDTPITHNAFISVRVKVAKAFTI